MSHNHSVEQQGIVRRVQGLFALADQIVARFQKAKAQVAKLTPSLITSAFRGQLVPQDQTDEPAEKLLDRMEKGAKTVSTKPNSGSHERRTAKKSD